MKRKLLSPEREKLIFDNLDSAVVRTITELSAMLGVSEATVRRDLQSLEEQGRAKRVHGGATRVERSHYEPLFNEKASFNADAKSHIAELALNYIEDHDTIFLDGGSTVLALARKLEHRKNLTVITNSMMAAAELMEGPHKLILIGGEFRPLSRTLVGPLSAAILKELSIQKAFMGTIGFAVEEGISTTDPNEAFTKSLVIKRSRKTILLADSSKIGISSLAASGAASDIDVVISDANISDKFVKMLQKKNIEVVF